MCQEGRTQQKGKLSRMSRKSNLNKESTPAHNSWGLAAATALGLLPQCHPLKAKGAEHSRPGKRREKPGRETKERREGEK